MSREFLTKRKWISKIQQMTLSRSTACPAVLLRYRLLAGRASSVGCHNNTAKIGLRCYKTVTMCCALPNLEGNNANCQQCNFTPSCRFSSRSLASSKVTVLAKLTVRTSQATASAIACDPKTNDVISSAVPVSSFMPIVIALLHFYQGNSALKARCVRFKCSDAHCVRAIMPILHANFYWAPMLLARKQCSQSSL